MNKGVLSWSGRLFAYRIIVSVHTEEQDMAAFDRIRSGIPMMDDALQNIRLGDNVVWQVPSLDEFRPIAERFAQQAVKDHRP